MKIVICYIAVTNGRITDEYCARFATTYHEHPPGVDHDVLIIANGGPLPTNTSLLFEEMKATMFPRQNDLGYDISAYIEASKGPTRNYDMMVCLGESNYFHRAGWLVRLVEAWNKHGQGMYGPYGTNVVRAHLQTTAFCCHPSMLSHYPTRVASKQARYEFEHGEHSLWRRLAGRGVPVRLVTWDGEWEPRMWRFPKDILWRGDQSNLLMWSNHSDAYRDADSKRKSNWSKSADRPFR